jgi:hypothetical protein
MEAFFNDSKDKKVTSKMNTFKRAKKVLDEDMESLKRWNTGSLLQSKIYFNIYGIPNLIELKKVYKSNLKKYHPDTNGATNIKDSEYCKIQLSNNIKYYRIIKAELEQYA